MLGPVIRSKSIMGRVMFPILGRDLNTSPPVPPTNAIINSITGGVNEIVIDYTGTLSITGSDNEIILEAT